MSVAQTPAAQYLRMSNERQEYSLEYQTQAIAKYAEDKGFCVVQTYSDPAISGYCFEDVRDFRK